MIFRSWSSNIGRTQMVKIKDNSSVFQSLLSQPLWYYSHKEITCCSGSFYCIVFFYLLCFFIFMVWFNPFFIEDRGFLFCLLPGMTATKGNFCHTQFLPVAALGHSNSKSEMLDADKCNLTTNSIINVIELEEVQGHWIRRMRGLYRPALCYLCAARNNCL